MTEAEALQFLESRVPPGDAWGVHSVTVARATGGIADTLRAAGAAVEPALVRTGGLLHDIGRSVTHDFAGHAWAGSQLLLAAGQPILARFCITHQCGGLMPEEAPLVGWPVADYRPHALSDRLERRACYNARESAIRAAGSLSRRSCRRSRRARGRAGAGSGRD